VNTTYKQVIHKTPTHLHFPPKQRSDVRPQPDKKPCRQCFVGKAPRPTKKAPPQGGVNIPDSRKKRKRKICTPSFLLPRLAKSSIMTSAQNVVAKERGRMKYFAGIDIGSLTCDAVIIDEAANVVSSSVVLTGARSRNAIESAFGKALESADLTTDSLAALISTGYGREQVEGRLKSITEISCHARGACFLFPETRLIIDIGGQDSKAVRVNERGQVVDFAMNDKCAAGTGRFFEVMSRALEIDLDDMGELAAASTKRLSISSMCTVFAESEVVSLVAKGERVEDIVAGLCRAVAERTRALAQRVGVSPQVTMTGGVAKNLGVVRALEELIEHRFNTPAEPQIVGALGAALFAREAVLSGTPSG
jgi:predicted CoA-substrate-specific enzyme activase